MTATATACKPRGLFLDLGKWQYHVFDVMAT